MGIRDYGLPTLTSMIGVGEADDVEADEAAPHATAYDDDPYRTTVHADLYRAATHDDPYNSTDYADYADYRASNVAAYDDDPYRTAVYADPYAAGDDETYDDGAGWDEPLPAGDEAATWAPHAAWSDSPWDDYRAQYERSDRFSVSIALDDEFAADCQDILAAYQASGWDDVTERVPAPAPAPERPASPAGGMIGRRAAALSRRLIDLGNARPVVRIPGTLHAPWRRSRLDDAALSAKLPPVWLLVNVVILLAAGLAVFPQLTAIHPPNVCGWYTVSPGDTLSNISAANHTSASSVAKANDIAKPDRITVGQRLCVPLAPGVQVIAPPAAARTTGHVSGVQPFIAFSLPFARRAHDQTGWPVSMILAQWGLEHGWRLPGYTGYNFGNCGAVPGEPTVGGINVPGSPAAFAYARTAEDGLRIYVHVAHLSYYSAIAPTAASQGADAAARALGRSPWDAAHYTDHNDPGSSLLAIMHNFNLYQYDK